MTTDRRPGRAHPRPDHRLDHRHEGNRTMIPQHQLAWALHEERLRRALAEIRVERLLRRPRRRPIRETVGRSMVRIGARLASDSPGLGPVRSR